MSKSILQEDRSRCYLCGGFPGNDPLDEHHVFGGANRKLSEKYGLKVYLHHSRCHEFGKNAVHVNAEVMSNLRAEAQKKAMEIYGWDTDEFIGIFGKSYIG